MNYYYVFYGISVADGIKNVFDTFSNIFTFLTVISLIAYAIVIGITIDPSVKGGERESALVWRKFIGRTFWFSIVVCIITWLGYVATPTKKDCLLIVAGGAVGNFITTDSSSKQLPSDITQFLHLSLKNEIKELGEEAKKEITTQLGIQTPKDKLIDKVKELSKEQIIEYLKNDSTITTK